MEIPTKRLENGFEMPVYGLGMWQMGGKREVDTTRDAEEIAAIRTAIDMGITHIDTAESYALGHSEELLGEAIKGYDRSKLFIASKVSEVNQGYKGTIAACEASLKRVGTDYFDLYMLHRFPAKGLSIEGTMRAMDELLERGLIRNIGISNVTPHRFDVAQSFTKNKIVANQVHYNVQYREVEKLGVVKHAQENDVMVVAWRPLQKGALPESELISDLAKKYQKTPAQIALNWLISQSNIVTLAKTSNPDHLRENLGALDFTMDSDDIELVRTEFPDQQFVSDAVPLDYEADTEM